MTNKLLGIIAINLTIITGLMVLQSIPTATAQSDYQTHQNLISGMTGVRLGRNYHFSVAVKDVVERSCTVKNDKKKITCSYPDL